MRRRGLCCEGAPGLKDIWQLHFSLNAGNGANPPDDFIANLEGSGRVQVDSDFGGEEWGVHGHEYAEWV